MSMVTYQERRAARQSQLTRRTQQLRTIRSRRLDAIRRRQQFRRDRPKTISRAQTQTQTITVKETMAEAIARLRNEGKIGSQETVKTLGEQIFIQKPAGTVIVAPTAQGYKFLPKKKLATRRLSQKIKAFEEFLGKSTRRHITGLKGGKRRSTEEKVIIGLSSGIVRGVTGLARLGLDAATGAQYLIRSKKARVAAASASINAAKATGRFTKKAFLAELRLKKAIGQNPKGVAEATYRIIKEAARKAEISVNKWIRTTSKDEKIRQITTIGGELFGTGAVLKGAQAIGRIRKVKKVIKYKPKVTRTRIPKQPVTRTIRLKDKTYKTEIDLGKAGKIDAASIRYDSGALLTASRGKLRVGTIRFPRLDKKGRLIGFSKPKPIKVRKKGQAVSVEIADNKVITFAIDKSTTNKQIGQLTKAAIKKAQKQSAGLTKAAARSKKAAIKLKGKPSKTQRFYRTRLKRTRKSVFISEFVEDKVIARKIKGLDLIPQIPKGYRYTSRMVMDYYKISKPQAKALISFYKKKRKAPPVYKQAQRGRGGVLSKEILTRGARGRPPTRRVRFAVVTKARRGFPRKVGKIIVEKGKYQSSAQTLFNLKVNEAKALKGLEKFLDRKLNIKSLKKIAADANAKVYGSPLTAPKIRGIIKRKRKLEGRLLRDLRKAKTIKQQLSVAKTYQKRGVIVPKKVKSYANRRIIVDASSGRATVVMKVKPKIKKRVVLRKKIDIVKQEANIGAIITSTTAQANALIAAAINQGTISFTQTAFKLGRSLPIPLPVSYINTAAARSSPQTITRIKNILIDKIKSKQIIIPSSKIKLGEKSKLRTVQQLKLGQKSKTKIKQAIIQLQEQKAAQIQLNKTAQTQTQLIKTIQGLKLKTGLKLKLIQLVTQKLLTTQTWNNIFFWIYYGGYRFKIYLPKSFKKKRKRKRRSAKGKKRMVSTRYTPSLAEALYKRTTRRKPSLIGLAPRPILIKRRKKRKNIRRRKIKRRRSKR